MFQKENKGHVDLFGLILFINNSSATTAPGTVTGHPKANEAQPLSTIPVQARCRLRCHSQLLPSHTESEKLWMYALCRHSVEIGNVSNMLQSRCIKCDWCGLLRTHLSKPQNYVLFLWWSSRIILYHQKKYDTVWIDIWLFLHPFIFVHGCPIWKMQTDPQSLGFGPNPRKINGLQAGYPCVGHHGHWNPMLLGDGFDFGDFTRWNGGIADLLALLCMYVSLLCPSTWECSVRGVANHQAARKRMAINYSAGKKNNIWGPFPTLFTVSACQFVYHL